MIVWSVIEKLDKDIKEKYPSLTEDEHKAMVWTVYHKIENEVLNGPTGPVGTLDFDFKKS